MTDRKLRVFICHSSADKRTVRELHKKLAAEDWIDAWLDEEKLLPGYEWDLEIEKAVEQADAVIVCLSSNSVTKEGYVQKEMRRILDKADEKPEGTLFIIPLRLDDCQPPRRLSTWQYVDYFPVSRRKQAYERLLKSLRSRADYLDVISETAGIAGAVSSKRTKDSPQINRTVAILSVAGLALVASTAMLLIRNFQVFPAVESTSTSTATAHTSTSTPTAPPTKTSTPSPTPTLSAGATQVSDDFGVTWVYVPSGGFKMGSDKGFPDEEPIHNVSLDAFWIGQTEVTNAMYSLCIENNICRALSRTDYYSRDATLPNYPVVFVSWNDAKQYCEWIGGRLPTEAEWEFAARGTDGRGYPWGDGFACNKGNFDDERPLDEDVVPGGPNCDGYQYIAPVGIFPGNISPYGALDMAGNVWEWVSDWYAEYEAVDAVNPTGPEDGDRRVVRGGAWLNESELHFRTSNRYRYPPELPDDNIGFRCVLPAE